eukprot:TRINITY_DN751_c0_g2_i1.p1 TRINITY_DN751_c0_g2~~TRINITY_DN751_c0_g2_i1.p1  ORF type:complete len:141 (-),score=16.87 TRINITY_DN751_c0_g2_i1:109-531(-)
MSCTTPKIAESNDYASFIEKLSRCEKIMTDDYLVKLPFCKDVLQLVDKQKVSFSVNQTELGIMLNKTGFSLVEQAYVKRLRHQGRNNLAAKKLREKKKMSEWEADLELESLRESRDRLEIERELLMREIADYRMMLSEIL